jgi:hypothetical protein
MDQVNESGGDRALLCGWSAIRKLAGNGLRGSVDEIREVCIGNLEVMARSGPPEIMDLLLDPN